LIHLIAYITLAVIWALITWIGELWLAAVFHGLSRLAYVGFVGGALWVQDHHRLYTRKFGIEEGFRRFRSVASVIMNNDGVSLAMLVWVTRGTFSGDLPLWGHLLIGGLLVLVGVDIKVWARQAIGDRGYYWYDFFAPSEEAEYTTDGPYRWMSNPMYTVGYAHTYGIALALASLPGLFAAVFDHISILVFWWLVERPHYKRLYIVESETATVGTGA